MSNQLQPIHEGIIVIAGVKPSNLSPELREHPQVVIWNSQNEHWLTKELPSNTRAVFTTRWIGHDAFTNIIKQARKRQITIFNPEGTGLINKQVKELLGMSYPIPKAEPMTTTTEPPYQTVTQTKETEIMVKKFKGTTEKKLYKLYPFIDFSKGPMDNARDILMPKAKELGIETTIGSLAQMVSVQRRKKGERMRSPRTRSVKKVAQSTDVAVDALDQAITGLKDVRDYLIQTVAENTKLRTKLDKFKRFFEE